MPNPDDNPKLPPREAPKTLRDVLNWAWWKSAEKLLGIAVAVVVGGAAWFFLGHNRAEAEFQRNVQVAPLEYAYHLRQLVESGAKASNAKELEVYARSIVKVRDD